MEEKSNEITAIPELLEKIQIKGQIVTVDAMGPQTKIAEEIRFKWADYVLALKGNQGTLYKEVREYFSDMEFWKEIEQAGNYKKTSEISRPGREKGVLPGRRYRVAGAEERLERFQEH